MRKCIVVMVSGFICIVLSGCAHSQGHYGGDLEKEVDMLGNRAEQAFLAGDVDTMLQYYCDDIISMPDGHSMIRGKADLKRQTAAILSSGLTFESLESTVVDVHHDGVYVYEIGTFRQSVFLPGTNEAIESAGKYVTIWERQPDGTLKIAVEIYNGNTPE